MGTETVTITGPADGAPTDPERLAVALTPHAAALDLTAEQIPRAAAAVCKGRTTLVAERLEAGAAELLMDEAEACGCSVTVEYHPEPVSLQSPETPADSGDEATVESILAAMCRVPLINDELLEAHGRYWAQGVYAVPFPLRSKLSGKYDYAAKRTEGQTAVWFGTHAAALRANSGPSTLPSTKTAHQPAPSPQLRCPTCTSTSISRVTTGQRVKSGLIGGLVFARDARARFRCHSCGHTW